MSKSGSERMKPEKAFRVLGLPRTASFAEITQTFQAKLAELQSKYSDKPDKLVQESDHLYAAYSAAFMSKEDANEDQMLPLTIVGPDTLLQTFGISDLPHNSFKVQTQSQAQYKDGQLVRKASNRTESFLNKDGKRELKVYEDGKLVKHTIDGVDQLKK